VVKDKTFKWWTDELHKIRMELRKLLHKAKRINTEESWSLHKEKLREYKYLTKKAKKESWKEFTSNTDTMIAQSKLNKIIFSETKTTLGALQSDYGWSYNLNN
jgi:hypothetical protein